MAYDVVQRIQAFNAGRREDLLALKYQKMRTSPFVFMRGTCHLFYDRLATIGIMKRSPSVWVCGDLHLENFGSYKGDNRLVYFDLNDFDESALAPASWELVRMLTSIELGAMANGIETDSLPALCQDFLQAYVAALSLGKAYWLERETAQGPVRRHLDSVRTRTRMELLDSRTTRKTRQRAIRVDGKKAVAVTLPQREAVTDFLKTFASTQSNPAFFEVLDLAQRVAGTGSLGLERFVILVKGKAPTKSAADGNYLLDLKVATPSSLLPHVSVKQPRWQSEAHRVVALQQRMQAVPMAFLHALQWGKRSLVLRALQPSEDRIAIGNGNHSAGELSQVLRNMGQLVAWAQLRSAGRQGSAIADELIDFSHAHKWQTRLVENARACADQTREDAQAFNVAYDNGVFGKSAARSRKA
jgi:uncharacterized protein (DUF2252 family)